MRVSARNMLGKASKLRFDFLSSLAGLALLAWALDPALKRRAIFNGKQDQRRCCQLGVLAAWSNRP
jgi:hypothetical protein